MRMTHVESGAIDSVGYERATQALEVRFANGTVYECRGVPPLVYAELMNADAMEAYFEDYVRGHYACRKVAKITPVVSTSLSSVGYNPQTKALYVSFNNGSAYEYRNVPPEVYAELMNAYSMGAYLNQHIRGKYPYRKIWIERKTLAPAR